jgi:hypothetical protein
MQNPPPKVYRPTQGQVPAGQSSVQFTIRLTASGPTGQNSVTTPVTVNVLRLGTLFNSGVFNTCTGSHGASGDCTLTPEQTTFDELRFEAAVLTCTAGQPRLLPYNLSDNNLFQKITATTPDAICGGTVMGELNGSSFSGFLEQAQKDQIRRWIEHRRAALSERGSTRRSSRGAGPAGARGSACSRRSAAG